MSQRRPVVGRVESVVGGSSRLSNTRSGRPDTSRHRHWRDRRGGTGRLSILPEPVRPARGNFVTERPHIYQNSFSDICRPVSLQLRFRNSKIGRVLIIVPILQAKSNKNISHTIFTKLEHTHKSEGNSYIQWNHQNFTYLWYFEIKEAVIVAWNCLRKIYIRWT